MTHFYILMIQYKIGLPYFIKIRCFRSFELAPIFLLGPHHYDGYLTGPFIAGVVQYHSVYIACTE